MTAPLGLRLPIEARVWWGWHDGTAHSLTSHAVGLDLIAQSLDAAAARYQFERQAAAEAIAEDVDPADLWQPEWFPLAIGGDGAVIACECGVADGEPSPIRYVHWEKVGMDSHKPVAPSLGTVVSWWIDAIDSGAWRYDRSAGRWKTRPELLRDPRLELTGLV